MCAMAPRLRLKRAPHASKRLRVRVVTECSGLEPLPYVLEKLRTPFQMVSACELSPACRQLIRQCHCGHARPESILHDIMIRRAFDLPDNDLYVAGFPCQPDSSIGRIVVIWTLAEGGRILEAVLCVVASKLPRAFILECQGHH